MISLKIWPAEILARIGSRVGGNPPSPQRLGLSARCSEAFLAKGGFQCGLCTPGFILMTKELLARHPRPNDEQIRHYLSGNLCRCGGLPRYRRIGENGG